MQKNTLATKVLEIVNLSTDDTIKINNSLATRSELCGDITKGGLTPEHSLIKEAIKISTKPIRVIIRPRAEDFCASPAEIDQMEKDILLCKELGYDGVVFSVITKDNKIDMVTNTRLLKAAGSMKSVFCKGIDLLEDKYGAITTIADMGFSGVLTQGGLGPIGDGMPELKKMLTNPVYTNGKFEIIAAGGVGLNNILTIKKDNFNFLHAGNLIREDGTYNTPISINKLNELVRDWTK